MVLPISDDEVAYTLTDLAPARRSAVTAILAEGDIAYRWGPGQLLAVAGGAQPEVDRVLEDLRSAGPDPEADGVADVDPGDGPGGEALDEDEQADGGEEATEAMSDLFVAADRLVHAPYDEAVGIDLAEAAATANACLPPYGIEMPVWRKVRDLANGVLSDLEQAADEDVVAAGARALRDLLRNYV